MIVAVGLLVVLAAAVHVYIFVLESLRWAEPATRRVFGTTAEQAATTRSLAFNQGFYNLFLAVGALAGVVALVAGARAVGAALVALAAGSMVAAALVLVLSDRTKARAAAVQGTFPALGLLALLLASA